MAFLLTTGVALVLLLAFLALTAYETSRGVRVLGSLRRALDGQVSRLSFIARHVDFSAFVKDVVRSTVMRFVHDVAHGVLIVVRAAERMLTGTVRELRGRREQDGAKDTIARAVSYAKHALHYKKISVAPADSTTAESE